MGRNHFECLAAYGSTSKIGKLPHTVTLRHSYFVIFRTVLEYFQSSLNKSALFFLRGMIYDDSPSDISPHTVTQWVRLSEYRVTIQNLQIHENALTTELNENTNVGHLWTAGSFMILMKSPSLRSVTVDSFGESGLGRVRLRNDHEFFFICFSTVWIL